jgi:fatty acid desaturase|tara:strand:- start:302 stop:1114 length:813 start_codon:yes stop_codon:yes gene_type:complete
MSSAMALFFFYPNVLTFLVALVIIGSRQFALAVLAHDAAHNLLFSNNKVNDWAGQWFCAYPIFQDNRVYRPYHLKHHRHTETEDDPDLVLSSPFPINKRSFIRKVFRDLTGITGVRRYWGSLSSIFRTKGDNVFDKISKTSNKLHGFLISNVIIFILISTTMHWSLFLLLWWLPSFTYYSLIIRIRNISEHAVTPGNNDFDNTRTTKSTVLTRFFMVPHNVNYHLEHHLFTRCPWYNLPKAHSMMIENGYEDKMCLETSYKNVLLKAMSA